MGNLTCNEVWHATFEFLEQGELAGIGNAGGQARLAAGRSRRQVAAETDTQERDLAGSTSVYVNAWSTTGPMTTSQSGRKTVSFSMIAAPCPGPSKTMQV